MEERNRNEVGSVVLKKGPWTAEEDEILMDYVRRNGPRDWSSIRSKDLLPRSGKSCRLRWVNKLKPDLKTGCKFTKEEERIVLDLQARFGNRWAKIATYLQGRTDNDVKNFWSTRQKRLARIQRAENAQEKDSGSDDSPADLTEEQMIEHYGYSLFTNRRGRESSTCESSNFPNDRDLTEEQMVEHYGYSLFTNRRGRESSTCESSNFPNERHHPNHDVTTTLMSQQQNLQDQHMNYSSNDMMNDMDPTLLFDLPLVLQQQQQEEYQYIDGDQTLVSAETQQMPEFSFSELPEPEALLDLPLLPEVDQDMDIGIADMRFEDPEAHLDLPLLPEVDQGMDIGIADLSFEDPEAHLDLPLLPEVDQGMDIAIADLSFEDPCASTNMLDPIPMVGLEGQGCEANGDDVIITNTLDDDDIFEEFPLDILDYVDQLPPPSN